MSVYTLLRMIVYTIIRSIRYEDEIMRVYVVKLPKFASVIVRSVSKFF